MVRKMSDDEFRLPSITDRTMIIGSNGSGKTQFAFWQLCHAHFDVQPFYIVDYKRDRLINSVERIKEIGLNEKLTRAPGVYILHPNPVADDEAMENWLMRVWEHENVGLWFDEGYMVPNKRALPAIYTQGRSKRINAITLSQRPAWLSRFAFSEANHYAVFSLSDSEDRKTMRRFMPENVDLNKRLPRFHSWWYTMGNDKAVPLSPVPDEETLQAQLDERLAPHVRRRVI